MRILRRICTGWMMAVAGATAAGAQEVSVDTGLVRACFDGADAIGAAPLCVGEASELCQDKFGYDTVSMGACIAAETQAWDDLLNETYGIVRPELARRDAEYGYAISTADELRNAQRAWIAFRDAECGLLWAMYQEGTMRTLIGGSCRLDMTARRVFELRALLEP